MSSRTAGSRAAQVAPTTPLTTNNPNSAFLQLTSVVLGTADDVLSERSERDVHHLERRETERNPNDGEAHCDARNDMPNRQPEAGDEEPYDVPDKTPAARIRFAHNVAAEGPQRIVRHPKACDSPRNRDDEDAANHSGEQVRQPHPYPRENEPDEIEQRAHSLRLGA